MALIDAGVEATSNPGTIVINSPNITRSCGRFELIYVELIVVWVWVIVIKWFVSGNGGLLYISH